MGVLEFKNEAFEATSAEIEVECNTKVGDIDDRTLLYEETLNNCGFGLFQVLLFLVCGWALASDSAEVQVVSFVLPTACDLNMTSHQKGWLSGIIFVGMMFGGYILGGAADVKGRRFMLLWSMSINGFFGLVSAFAPTFAVFMFFRFLSGVGVGAAMPIIFTYCAEFMNINRRGAVLAFLASFWMVGNILVCIIARFILPRTDVGIQLGSIYFGSWRLYIVLGAIPSITSTFFMFLMPESPMFLQKCGRYEEAYAAFLRIFKTNFGRDVPVAPEVNQYLEYYSLHKNLTEKENRDEEEANNNKPNRIVELTKTTIAVIQSTTQLFQKPHRHTTLMLLLIWSTLSFGFYGLWMWFPEIFKRIETGGGSTCSTTGRSSGSHVTNLTCEQLRVTQTTVYWESLYVALSNIPGNLLAVLFIGRIGRRPMLAGSMIFSAVSVLFFSMVKDRVGMIIMSCIFSGVSVAGWGVLDMLSIENYPTHLRSLAFGVCSGFGRVAAVAGNVTFGLLVDEHCAIPLLLVASLLSIGGLTTMKMPKTDDKALAS